MGERSRVALVDRVVVVVVLRRWRVAAVVGRADGACEFAL